MTTIQNTCQDLQILEQEISSCNIFLNAQRTNSFIPYSTHCLAATVFQQQCAERRFHSCMKLEQCEVHQASITAPSAIEDKRIQ